MIRNAILALALLATPVAAAEDFILVQSTTSTQNSGLFDHLLPQFTAAIGTEVRVVAVGTGQAIKNAEACDGDVLLVHAKAAEEAFVANGFGAQRFDVMYNDLIVIGPVVDPAKIGGMTDVVAAFSAIAGAKAPFASRGDDSGTHRAGLAIWNKADVDVKAASGGRHRETGSGMGATLNVAAGMGAYALTDRATWSSFGNKAGFTIAVQGDPAPFNQYGVILANPAKCPSVKSVKGQAFVDWLIGSEGQAAIASFRIEGEQQRFPNAVDAPKVGG